MTKRFALLAFAAFAGRAPAQTTTTWQDTGQDSSWSNSANWDHGAPAATTPVVIGVQPTGNLIGVDTGAIVNTVPSFTFGAGLTGSVEITHLSVEQLTIAGPITNASGLSHLFSLFVLSPGASVATGGGLTFSGGLEASGVLSIAGAGSFTLGSGASTVLDLSSSLSGSLRSAGTVNYNHTNLVFDLTGAQSAGQSWEIVQAGTVTGSPGSVSFAGGSYSGALTKTSPGVWLGTAGGRSWEFTEADGLLQAVPEPGSAALLAGSAGWLCTRRRRPSFSRG